MHPATRQIRDLVGAGAAATLAALALTVISTPAYATPGDATPTNATAADANPADPGSVQEQPTLWVTNTVGAYIHESGVTIGLNLSNEGTAPATDVTVTYDGDQLTDDVLVSLTDTAPGCQLTGKSAVCEHGDLAPGQVDRVEQIVLTSRTGARAGTGGAIDVILAGTGPDGTPASVLLPLDVEILADPDLVVAAEDVGSAEDRVGPGDTRPLRAVVINRGVTEAQNVRVKAVLPSGATFAERYEECVYEGARSGTPPAGYVYDATTVTCLLPLALKPGEGLVLADQETDEALFNAVFGKNLPGPASFTGSFEVDEDKQASLPDPQARAGTAGDPSASPAVSARAATDGKPSRLADRVTVVPAPVKSARAARDPWPDNIDILKPVAEFDIWSKANSYDFVVAATSVTGAVGDTVEVPYTITNRGPSDGSASWRIVAPSGTVLLPSEWCSFNDDQGQPVTELAEVECRTDGAWLAEASGSGTVSGTIRLKIKSAPGTNGTITVRPDGHSTETNTANNTARIVINEPGGAGGELPITGARPGPTGALGASAVLLGVLLLVLVRRRQVSSTD